MSSSEADGEFTGTPAEGKRPDGSTRWTGMPQSMVPHQRPKDRLRATALSGDPSGQTPPSRLVRQGLDPDRFEEIAREQARRPHNRLTDP